MLRSSRVCPLPLVCTVFSLSSCFTSNSMNSHLVSSFAATSVVCWCRSDFCCCPSLFSSLHFRLLDQLCCVFSPASHAQYLPPAKKPTPALLEQHAASCAMSWPWLPRGSEWVDVLMRDNVVVNE